MTNNNLGHQSDAMGDFELVKLQSRVKRSGTASVIFGSLQLAIALIVGIIILESSDPGDVGSFAFALLIFIPIALVGLVFIILGSRVRHLRDVKTKTYLWVLLSLSVLAVMIGTAIRNISNGQFGGASVVAVVMIVLLAMGLSSWGRLQRAADFRNKLTAPTYSFSGAWWAVLLLPSLLIIIFCMLVLGQA